VYCDPNFVAASHVNSFADCNFNTNYASNGIPFTVSNSVTFLKPKPSFWEQ
jgi:hypothetical protein